MSSSLPEGTPSSERLTQSDHNAEILQFTVGLVDTPIELRSVFEANCRGLTFYGTSRQSLGRLSEAITGKLYGLGLNMDDREDERINGFMEGAEALTTSKTASVASRGERPLSMFLTGYQRLLGAIDTNSETRLQLLPAAELVQATLLRQVAAAALSFTAEAKYTTPHRYGRKAHRRVSDPASPYWDFAMSTDTYPGTTLGSAYTQGPNVHLYVPTGAIALSSASHLKQKERTAPDFVPTHINLQTVHVGMARPEDAYDTTTGLVRRFLRYAAQS